MGRIDGLRRFFRLPETSESVTRDAEQEVDFHLEMKVKELISKGMSAEDARAEAVRRFGDVGATRERIEQIDRERLGRERRAAWWSAVAQDLRYAVRGLGRQRGFTAVVVLTLGLGIGANATMFGIVDRLLLRAPPHVEDADRVARVYFVYPRTEGPPLQIDRGNFPQFAMLRDRVTAFEHTAPVYSTGMVLGDGVDARTISGVMTTSAFFPLLGVRPALGRFFQEDEDRIGDPRPVAVLGHGLWQSEFGGDPGVIGREIRLGQVPYTVVGVAPRGFTGADLERVDVWVPIAAAGSIVDTDWADTRAALWITVLARLAPDVDPEQATVQATAAFHEYIRGGSNPERSLARNPRVELASVLRERGPDRTDASRIALWLTGVAAVVLLVACANVANLLLARATRRRREIAVRVALGIGRGRLLAQLTMESLLLAMFGGAAGLLIARWGSSLVHSLLLPDMVWTQRLLDARLLAFTAAVAIVTAMLAGLVPALHAVRPDVAGSLKWGGREGSARRSRTGTVLLIGQAAFSVVLLVGAGLFVLSLRNVHTEDLGFDADRVLLATYDFRGSDLSPAAQAAAYERAFERVARIPGVERASLGTTAPFSMRISNAVRVPGRDSIPRIEAGNPHWHAITPGWFETMGTRLVDGRVFTDADDRAQAAPVSIVNQTMADLLWPGERAIGRCFMAAEGSSPCLEVVGVVQDSRANAIRPERVMKFYVPLAQDVGGTERRTLFVRGGADVEALTGAVRHEMQAAAPQAFQARVTQLARLIDPQVRPWRLGATMFTAFGLLALVLAAIGLYGVMAYSVTQRAHEMGIRMALGARRGDVLGLVLAEGVRLAVAGVGLGILMALIGTPRLAPLLYEVDPGDPRVLAGVAMVLLAVAVVANLLPAWRAARVDPIAALRAE